MNGPGRSAPRQAWHRVPLMWLVLAVPALTVVGGFVTLWLAARGSDPVVRDAFRREGLAIYVDPARDAAAVAAGARARLTFGAPGQPLRAVVKLRHGPLPDRLLLVLSHATRAELDRLVALTRVDGGYEGRYAPLPEGRWHLELTPPNRAWRLRGEFVAPGRVLDLEAGGER